MKRFLARALPLALLVAFAAPARAQVNSTGPQRLSVPEPLKFRTHAAAFGPGVAGYSGTDGLGGFSDSAYTQRVGSQTCILDTTEDISTYGWGVIQNQALSDTSGFFCQLLVYDYNGSGCESGADSLYAAVQASPDGVTWFTLPTFKAGTKSSIASRLDQANVAGAFFGALTMNGASLSTGAPVWRVLYKQRAVSGWDNPDVGGAWVWPYLRWIIGFPDAKGYKVKASVTHISVTDSRRL